MTDRKQAICLFNAPAGTGLPELRGLADRFDLMRTAEFLAMLIEIQTQKQQCNPGGCLEPEESTEETAIREVERMIGVTPTLLQVQGL